MDVSNELVYNFLIELKKKEISPIDRAVIIKSYIKENGMSARGLAKELGMPHSTLQDWMDYDRISKVEFEAMIDKGINKKTIHKTLRTTRGMDAQYKAIVQNDLNIQLQNSIVSLTCYMNNPEFNTETSELIKKLKNILNRIELNMDLKNKGTK